MRIDPTEDQMPARSPGRPRLAGKENVGNRSVGRESLIEATVELLKTTPPSQITPTVVARSIGVHQSLIRYYFKTRASLLLATAEAMHERFGKQVEAAAAQSDGTPKSRLFARIGAIIDMSATFPFYHQLINLELAGSDDPAATAVVAHTIQRATGAYGSILRAGLADGSFRGTDANLLFATIVGMSEFFLAAHRQLEIGLGTPIDEAEMRGAYKAFVCNLVLNGIGA